MSYASDLTDEQWALLEPVFNAPGKRGPKHAPDLRRVVDAMLHISHTGCQWRFLPQSFGPWTTTAAAPTTVRRESSGSWPWT
jgi:transposase